jgi:hypothetical protein
MPSQRPCPSTFLIAYEGSSQLPSRSPLMRSEQPFLLDECSPKGTDAIGSEFIFSGRYTAYLHGSFIPCR